MFQVVSIRTAKPAVKPYKIGCGHGLFLLVNPNGSKLWRFKYRFEGREKTLTFGAYPLVGLLDARMQRDAAKLQLLNGIDPAQARKKEEVVRFEVIAEQWYQANAACWAPSTAKKVRIYLDKDILPAIGRHAIQGIQRGDLINLLASVESREAFNVASNVNQRAKLSEKISCGTTTSNRSGQRGALSSLIRVRLPLVEVCSALGARISTAP